jgi:hypothetical protein
MSEPRTGTQELRAAAKEPEEPMAEEGSLEREEVRAEAATIDAYRNPPNIELKSENCCECIVRFYELLTSAKASTLNRAELFTLTGDGDNKDHDTGIYITVKTSDDKALLASINNADSSGKDMTEYNDDSHHIVPLVIEAPGATKDTCGQFKVRMWIKTNGNDEWDIDDARVTLYFSDGTTLVAEQLGFNLINDGASTNFAAP